MVFFKKGPVMKYLLGWAGGEIEAFSTNKKGLLTKGMARYV